MRRINPLIAFAVLIAFTGLYQNWNAALTEAWWFAVAGGMCLAVLHFATPHAKTAFGALGAILLMLALFDTPIAMFADRSMFSGLACGLLAGLCLGYVVKAARKRQ